MESILSQSETRVSNDHGKFFLPEGWFQISLLPQNCKMIQNTKMFFFSHKKISMLRVYAVCWSESVTVNTIYTSMFCHCLLVRWTRWTFTHLYMTGSNFVLDRAVPMWYYAVSTVTADKCHHHIILYQWWHIVTWILEKKIAEIYITIQHFTYTKRHFEILCATRWPYWA